MGYGRPAICLFAVLLLSGCGSSSPQPVSPQAFYSNALLNQAPFPSNDQRGITPQVDPRIPPPSNKPQPPEPQEPISKSLQEALKIPVPDENAATQPTTVPDIAPPATNPAFVPPDFLILGAVIATVNGNPIYTNTILRRNADLFRNDARQYDLKRFEIAARELITKGRDELIQDEIEYVAAERSLGNEDKARAKALMGLWRNEQLNQAHGSIELVYRQWLAKGLTFEQAEDDQYRSFMVLLYYQKEIWDNVVVSADEERKFYYANIKQFTTLPEATIYIIRQNPDLCGSADVALSHIQDYRKRALAGEDFSGLATNYSDKPDHDTDKGLWVLHRNTIRLRKVEDAAFTVPPGQISDVIEDLGGFYIIKVVSRTDGGVKPFEDEQVQASIHDTLRQQKFRELRAAHLYKLEVDNTVEHPEDQVDLAVQMALQNYPRWSMK